MNSFQIFYRIFPSPCFVPQCFSLFSPLAPNLSVNKQPSKTQILFCSDFSKKPRMQNPHPHVTKGHWEHIACKTANGLRNLPYFKAVEKVLAEDREESKPRNEGNQLCPFVLNHQGVSLGRRALWHKFRASPALHAAQPLPTDDTQSGERLCLFAG